MFSYNKLWALLKARGINKQDLRALTKLGSNTMAKMAKGIPISGVSIARICEALHCQPADILEYVFPESDSDSVEQINSVELVDSDATSTAVCTDESSEAEDGEDASGTNE